MITSTYPGRAIASCFLFLVVFLLSVDLRGQTSRTAVPSEEESTTVGGYGEIHYIEPEGSGKGSVDVPRFILFLEHYFSPEISFFSELEVEHTKLEGGKSGGEVALEQAYLQYNLDERFNVRAGLMVLPIGIINEYHEPPTFNGVVRPRFDRSVIPSTWRDIGVGFVGRIPEVEGLQYRAYLTNGLNAASFSGADGIRGGRLQGAQAPMQNLAISARLEYLSGGLRAGGWMYYGGSSLGNGKIAESSSSLFGAPVSIVGADAQFTISNLYLRGVFGMLSLPDGINDAFHRVDITDTLTGEIVGHRYDNPVGNRVAGGYIEAAYDVMKLIEPTSSKQLLPFVRYESFNTHAEVEAGITANPAFDRTFVVTGLTFKPTYNSVFKLDWTFAGNATDQTVPGAFALGVGYNF